MLTEIVENIFQVQIPVPFPLKVVNCYLTRGEVGWDMVDTGLQDPAARAAWEHAWRALAIQPRDIRRIYVTHAHPDHYGLAGYFQDLTGAPVLMLDHEIRNVPLEWHPDGEHMYTTARFFERHGLPHSVGEGVLARQFQVLAMVQPQPILTPLREGERIELGRHSYNVIWARGHADGHMLLHREADGLMFIGDQVLNKITPNIALWPRLDPNPLKHYLDSLAQVEQLQVARALPGHRGVIENLPQRIMELRAHHAARLEECMAAATDCSAYEICLKIFPRLESVDDVRMAMVETLSHLAYLVEEGRLAQRDTQPISFARAATVARWNNGGDESRRSNELDGTAR